MTKIIVVNNEPDLEKLIEQKFRRQIKDEEYVFIFSRSLSEALDLIYNDQEIEVVVADANLPSDEGFTLLGKLQKIDRGVISVIISPYGNLNAIRKAMNLGAYDFITRPINLGEFEEALKKVIEKIKEDNQTRASQKALLDIEKELDVAKSIQSSIIPHQFDPYPGNTAFELLGTMRPARRIGGDFFDFFPLPGNRLGFSIADVSGKGVPAALFMTMSRGLLRAFGQKNMAPIDCMKQLNNLLTSENESSMFVTAFYGILEIDTGTVTYCNAGHTPPYLISINGEAKQIGRSEGIALGVTTELITYEEHTFKMNQGDILLLYTDGVTEAMNPTRQLYQEDSLEKILQKVHLEPLNSLIEHVIEDVEQFANGSKQADDLTLLVIRKL